MNEQGSLEIETTTLKEERKEGENRRRKARAREKERKIGGESVLVRGGGAQMEEERVEAR